MRPSRPTKATFRQATLFVRRPIFQSRQRARSFHQSCALGKRSNSKYPFFPGPSSHHASSKPSGQTSVESKESRYSKPYSASDRAELAKMYSPAQLAAIEAGEAAIHEADLAKQAKLRRDPLQFQYLDDFARIEPVIDKKIERLRDSAQQSENFDVFVPAPDETAMLQRAAQVEHEAKIEDVGGWVPVRSKNVDENEQMEQGPLRKLELRRTPHQLAKAALKEYLGTPTVKGAMEYCWRRDTEMIVEEDDVPPAKKAAEVEVRHASLEERFADLQLEGGFPHLQLPELSPDDDRPCESAYFEQHIQPDPQYKAILQKIIDHPPPAQHFGTPALERKIRKIFDPPMPDVAPEIPKINDPSVRWGPSEEDDSQEGTTLTGEALADYERMAKDLGQTIFQLRSYRAKTLTSHFVVNQTRMGKIGSRYVLCVAGNENGMVGLGEGKSSEGAAANRMARLNAIKNMVPILRYENRTIYGELHAKVGAAEVKLSARQPGFGLRTSWHVFEIARCAGLADLSAKLTRSRNPMNVAKAVWEALRSQKDPEDVARARGKKFVDTRKVYYSGLA